MKILIEDAVYFYGNHELVNALEKQYKDRKNIKDWRKLELIGLSNNDEYVRYLKNIDIDISQNRFRVSTEFQLLHIALAKRGLGLTPLTETAAKHEPQLKKLFGKEKPLMHIPLWLVSHRELRTNPRVKRVFDILAQYLQKPQPNPTLFKR